MKFRATPSQGIAGLIFLIFSGIVHATSPIIQTMTTKSTMTTIVVLADTPYSDKEKCMLLAPNGSLFKAINQVKPRLVMHLGDMKSGGASCTDELLQEHKVLLGQIYPGKMLYTPGDNDWTDCDRLLLFSSFDELERLAYLKKLMYQTAPLLDKNLTEVTAQKQQIENKLWLSDRLAVATLHIVGTSNGRAQIRKSSRDNAIGIADKRDKFNLLWLEETIKKSAQYDALIIGFQADIYQKSVLKSKQCDEQDRSSCDAFGFYRNAFKALAKRLNKPVLIMHGDTGEFCFEQRSNNLWHLNAAGDFRHLDGVRVTFDNSKTATPFKVQGLLDPFLPKIGCVE